MLYTTLLLALALPQEASHKFHAAPISMAVNQTTGQYFGNLETNQVYIKYGGVRYTAPLAHPEPDPGYAHFSYSTQYGHPPWVVTDVEIDAFSTSVNYFAGSGQGVVAQGANSYEWAGFVFSVKGSAAGVEPGNAFLNSQPNGGDVFEYMFPGSSQGFPGDTGRAIDSSWVRILEGNDNPEIVALAAYIPVLLQAPAISVEAVADLKGVAFSLTDDSIQHIPSTVVDQWFTRSSGGPPSQERTGAAVFACDWVDYGTYKDWGDVYLLAAPSDLTYGSTVPTEVTALAWHHRPGEPLEDYLIYAESESNEVMFFNLDQSTGPHAAVPVMIQEEGILKKASERIGLGVGDRVDAISAFDPRDWGTIIRHEPTDPVGCGQVPPLESTLVRVPGSPNDSLLACMSDPTDSVVANWAFLFGKAADGQEQLLTVLTWPGTGTTQHVVGDVPLPLLDTEYRTRWEAVLTLEPKNLVACSAWAEIDI